MSHWLTLQTFLFFLWNKASFCFLIFNKCGVLSHSNRHFICFLVWPKELCYVVMLIFHIFRTASETTETNEIDPDASTSKSMFSADFFLLDVSFNPLNANPTKWSNTQTIRQLIADELFECVWPFCGVLVLKGLKILLLLVNVKSWYYLLNK